MSKLSKWTHGAIPALLIHCSVGSVYAWSLFVKPISEAIGASTTAVQFAFSLAIFFLGMSAAFGGHIVEKNVTKSAFISAVFFVTGLIVTGISIKVKSLIGIYLGYGCIMGVGLGVGYLTPVKTLMMWFTDNKGLATGIAITGFGFASTIASPLITKLMSMMPVEMVFLVLAAIYLVPMLLAAVLIKKPHKDVIVNNDFKYVKILKDPTFIKIWLVMFINITCGLALIGTASPMMSSINISPAMIAVIVAIMGITNGFGRLGIATLSDKMRDRKYAYTDFLILSIILSIIGHVSFKSAMQSPGMSFAIAVPLILIPAFYGAGFSCLPALLSDIYGMRNISKIHGLTLTSWAIAGLCGNQMANLIYISMGSYAPVFTVIATLYTIALVIAMTIPSKTSCL